MVARRIGSALLALIAGRSPSRAPGRRDPLGPAGERVAARFLRRAGYRVLARNVRLAHAEADLLCLTPDRRTLVIVEVKSRRCRADGSTPLPPETNVHARKRRKLVGIWRGLSRAGAWRGRPVRIDAVAVEFPPEGRAGRPVVRHHPGAVRAGRW